MLNRIYKEVNTNRGPSNSIWSGCPVESFRDGIGGFILEDYFVNAPVFATTVSQNGWYPVLDSNVTLKGDPTTNGGGLKLTTTATDNDFGYLTSGGNAAGAFKIVAKGSGGKKLWFETRVKYGSITELASFIGLAEEGLAAAGTLTDDTGVIADKDYVGFRVVVADGDGLDAAYRIDGGSEVVAKEEAQVLVADTWYKLGMTWDPSEGASGILRFYINGTSVGTVAGSVITAGTTFPTGEELALLFAFKQGEAAAKSAHIDWVRCAQEYL